MLGCWLWPFTSVQDLGLTKIPGIVFAACLFLWLSYVVVTNFVTICCFASMLLNSGASSHIGVFLQLILIIVCIDCLEKYKVTFVIKVIVEHVYYSVNSILPPFFWLILFHLFRIILRKKFVENLKLYWASHMLRITFCLYQYWNLWTCLCE